MLREISRKLRLSVILKELPPFRGIVRLAFFHELLQDKLRIPHKRYVGFHVLAYLRRIHVYVYGGKPLFDLCRLHYGPVCHPHAYHDHKVGLDHGFIGGSVSKLSYHAHIQRIVSIKERKSHHGRNHRDLHPVSKFLKLLFGMGKENSSAGTDDRPFGLRYGPYHMRELLCIALDTWIITPDVHRLRKYRILYFLGLYILREIYQNRSRTPR